MMQQGEVRDLFGDITEGLLADNRKPGKQKRKRRRKANKNHATGQNFTRYYKENRPNASLSLSSVCCGCGSTDIPQGRTTKERLKDFCAACSQTTYCTYSMCSNAAYRPKSGPDDKSRVKYGISRCFAHMFLLPPSKEKKCYSMQTRPYPIRMPNVFKKVVLDKSEPSAEIALGCSNPEGLGLKLEQIGYPDITFMAYRLEISLYTADKKLILEVDGTHILSNCDLEEYKNGSDTTPSKLNFTLHRRYSKLLSHIDINAVEVVSAVLHVVDINNSDYYIHTLAPFDQSRNLMRTGYEMHERLPKMVQHSEDPRQRLCWLVDRNGVYSRKNQQVHMKRDQDALSKHKRHVFVGCIQHLAPEKGITQATVEVKYATSMTTGTCLPTLELSLMGAYFCRGKGILNASFTQRRMIKDVSSFVGGCTPTLDITPPMLWSIRQQFMPVDDSCLLLSTANATQNKRTITTTAYKPCKISEVDCSLMDNFFSYNKSLWNGTVLQNSSRTGSVAYAFGINLVYLRECLESVHREEKSKLPHAIQTALEHKTTLYAVLLDLDTISQNNVIDFNQLVAMGALTCGSNQTEALLFDENLLQPASGCCTLMDFPVFVPSVPPANVASKLPLLADIHSSDFLA